MYVCWLITGILKNRVVHQTMEDTKKDFITLKCLAAQSGLTTSHEQSQFRACHDIHKRDKGERRQSQSQRLPEDIVYGISTR